MIIVSVVRIGVLLLLLAGVGYLAATGLSSRTADSPARVDRGAWFSIAANVTGVSDGDSIRVRIGRRSERVRLIGIDAPELGTCYWRESSAALTTLVLGKRVRLIGDRTQARRDVYKRRLAYVVLRNGTDAGRYLLTRGFAVVFDTNRPFVRQAAYAKAAADAAASGAGLHVACSQTRTTLTETIVTSTETIVTSTEPIDPPIPIPTAPTVTAVSRYLVTVSVARIPRARWSPIVHHS